MTDQQKDSYINSTIPMLNLDNALKDLSYTSHRIKDSFLRNNGPDPLELTKRMENLENKLELLKSECAEVEKYRLQLAVEVTQVLAENATEIQEVCHIIYKCTQHFTGGNYFSTNSWEYIFYIITFT